MPGVAAPEIEVVRGEIARPALLEVAPLPGGERQPQLAGHPLGDIRLHVEDVGERRVERLLPLGGAGRRLDQLGAHAYPALGPLPVPAHRAREEVVDPELAADLPRRLGGVGILGRARARHHLQAGDGGQLAADLVGDPVGEVGVVRCAEIVEREHRDAPETGSGRVLVAGAGPREEDAEATDDAEPEREQALRGGVDARAGCRG